MNREELGIASYGASVTTMEEVFLRYTQGSDHHTGFRSSHRVKIITQGSDHHIGFRSSQCF